MAGPDGLLERDREILFIEGAIDSAMSGSGRAAMVCGEAGIGK
jgi:hypothetical protein